MSLSAGTRLAHYEILEPIGAGAMGDVYRAKDTKLRRDVAIKVLPDEFAQDQERLARFQREAELLAALNHTNIATIHGLEESDGIRFLVMELVDGETLAERIARGPIPHDEALPVFKQIAEGLEVGRATVERVRRQFVEEGLEAALERHKPRRQYARTLDGDGEAHLIALACSQAPEGRSRWTLRLPLQLMYAGNVGTHKIIISHIRFSQR